MLESVADSLKAPARSSISTTSSIFPAVASTSPSCSIACPIFRSSATSRDAAATVRPSRCSRSQPLSIDDATTLFVELAAARGVLLQEDALAFGPRDLPEAGRPAARDRARRRATRRAPAGGDPARARRGARTRDGGPVDLPERQRTLRAAIDWSYSRLSPSQRAAARHARGVRATAARSTTRAARRARALEFLTRSRGARRVEPRSQRIDGRRAATVDARDRARARARAASRARRLDDAAAASCRAVPRTRARGRRRARRAGASGVARAARARVRQPTRGSRLAA